MRTRLYALLASLATAVAIAALLGSPVPGQAPPPTLPANTVYGRLAIGTGPGQAIPLGTLLANLFNGASTFTAHSVLIGEGTSPVAGATTGTAGQLLIDQGAAADPLFQPSSGDVTNTAAGVFTIAAGAVTGSKIATNTIVNSNLAQMAANTIKGNNTGSTANAADLTPGQVGGILCVPVPHIFTSGSSQTYTTDTCNSVTATWLEVDVQGGGGGGAGSGTNNNAGTAGNASSFGALTANGGAQGAGAAGAGGAGGTCSGSLGTQQNFPGNAGNGADTLGASSATGGQGGTSFYGGAGASGATGAAGGAAPANSGGGGAGGSSSATAGVNAVGGGGAGCHIKSWITSSVAATYTYTVGGTAAGGGAGTSGFAGGQGAAGLITVVAHWQ